MVTFKSEMPVFGENGNFCHIWPLYGVRKSFKFSNFPCKGASIFNMFISCNLDVTMFYRNIMCLVATQIGHLQ